MQELRNRRFEWRSILTYISLATGFIFVGVFVGIYPNIGLIVAIGLSSILLLIGVLLQIEKRFPSIKLFEYVLFLYVVLFSLSHINFFRINITGYDFPSFIILLPFLLLLLRNKARTSRSKKLWLGLNIKRELIIILITAIPVTVSVVLSINISKSIQVLLETGIFISSYFVFVMLVDDFLILRRVIWLYVIAIGVVMLSAIYHYFFSPLHWYRLVADEGRRANQFAFMFEIGWLVLFERVINGRMNTKLILYSIGFMIFSFGLILTYSRGAWVSTLAAGVVLIYTSRKHVDWKRLFLFLLFGIAIVFQFDLSTLWLRVQSIWNSNQYYDPSLEKTIQPSNLGRVEIFERYLKEVNDNPFVGVGYGIELDVNPFGIHQVPTKTAHNSYLSILTSSGIIAFLGLILFFWIHGLSLLQVKSFLNSGDVLWGNILLAAYIAMLIHFLVSNFLFSYIAWFLLGFQGAAIKLYSLKSSK